MSKYFDQTARLHLAPAVADTTTSTATADLTLVPQAPSPAPEVVPTERVNDAPAIEIPVARLIEGLFGGSDSLKSAQESYRSLRTRLLRQKSIDKLRSFVITSSTQGEGKTLTAANLALCCAQLHEVRVLLIDGDIRSHGLTRLLHLQGKAGLANVLEGKRDPSEALLATDCGNLSVMGCGSSDLPPAELLASAKWKELMEWSRQYFELVIVDSPPVLNLADVELISSFCDGILVVVRAQQTRREVLQSSVAQLDSKKIVGVVFNGTKGGRHSYDYAYKAPQGS
jgi:capsular exopolysaccharide synthesis family protein